MKRAPLVPPVHVTSKRWTFFCAMLGFLMLPFMPVQFTSVLTAVVWIFAGVQYAVVFTILGTFRFDSPPIFVGITNILSLLLPRGASSFSQEFTILLMYFGNLGTAYFFKKVLIGRLVRRIRND
jgi:hypothetical protein